ncbi:hypothetical protein BC829DRAFT_393886 [Chytridium lagenaria]|nr:hypothetical protein BC829DRAFT_393886 [Chytridium lagenaria]
MPSSETKAAPKRIAIIGSGVAGLGAAWLLAREPEKDYFGGHTHTVDVPSLKDPEQKTGVDTGFIVCNPVTYPNFLNFLQEIKVPLQRSDMSFSVSRNDGDLEWSGDNLNTVFAQRKNILPIGHGHDDTLGMYSMIYQIIRFHRQAATIAEEADSLQFDEEGRLRETGPDDKKVHPFASMTLGEFFRKFGYSRFFYENYVLPMTAAIWSTPANMAFDKFPLLTLVRFMRNHIMLQIGGRPKWRTVYNGSREYVERVLSMVPDARLSTPVTSFKRVTSSSGDVQLIVTDANNVVEKYDHKRILGSIKFVNNRAILHRDRKLMPKRRLAWSSWNYMTRIEDETRSQSMCLTYWMNRLQPYINPKVYGQVFPDPKTVLGEWDYTHPLYSPETIAAQDNLNSIQNKKGVTFAGAWTNYGFHEDGLTSGLQAAESIGAITCPFPIMPNGGYPTHRLPPPASTSLPKYVNRAIWEEAIREAAMKSGSGTLGWRMVSFLWWGVVAAVWWRALVQTVGGAA